MPFFLSGPAGGPSAVGTAAGKCTSDFLLIRDGFDPVNPNNIADRYCGAVLNPVAAGSTTASSVCSK